MKHIGCQQPIVFSTASRRPGEQSGTVQHPRFCCEIRVAPPAEGPKNDCLAALEDKVQRVALHAAKID